MTEKTKKPMSVAPDTDKVWTPDGITTVGALNKILATEKVPARRAERNEKIRKLEVAVLQRFKDVDYIKNPHGVMNSRKLLDTLKEERGKLELKVGVSIRTLMTEGLIHRNKPEDTRPTFHVTEKGAIFAGLAEGEIEEAPEVPSPSAVAESAIEEVDPDEL